MTSQVKGFIDWKKQLEWELRFYKEGSVPWQARKFMLHRLEINN